MPPPQIDYDDDQIKQIKARVGPGWIDGLSTSSTNADASRINPKPGALLARDRPKTNGMNMQAYLEMKRRASFRAGS